MILHTRPIQLLTGNRATATPVTCFTVSRELLHRCFVNFSMHRSIITAFWEVFGGAWTCPLGYRKSAIRYKIGKSSFFDKNELHVADAILQCIDEYLSRFGLFRRHVLCANSVGIEVHDTLAKRTSTSRSKKAAPRRDNVVLSLRAFDFPLVLQCNSLRIGPF